MGSDNNVQDIRAGSDDADQSENSVFVRNKAGSTRSIKLWRSSSFMNFVNPIKKRSDSTVLNSSPTTPSTPTTPMTPTQTPSDLSLLTVMTPTTSFTPTLQTIPKPATTPTTPTIQTPLNPSSDKTFEELKKYNETALVLSKPQKNLKSAIKSTARWGSLVSVVLVEAKGLPSSPTDGSSHGVYCKIRLGSQALKSKTVHNVLHPEWRERFQFHLFNDYQLKVYLWDKGKQKTFMGSSILDLSQLEEERTHELWQELDEGYGVVRLSVTICNIRRRKEHDIEESKELHLEKKHALFNPNTDWKLVGQLYVKVISAKGLSGKPSAYCTLEVDNERVRTHSARGSAEPNWNKSFVFNVYDVTSTLDLKVYDSSLMTSLHNESLGRVSIPLLTIRNGETKWFGLKDKSKRNTAKGSSPRVLLEMFFFYNPVKASLRVFQPKEVKYIKKPQKFDIALIYKNLEFVRDTFDLIVDVNESYKRLFEWDNQELSFLALTSWLLFWYHFKLWTAPLLLLAPFLYFWLMNRHQQEKSFMRNYGVIEIPDKDSKGVPGDKGKPEKSLTGRIQELPEMTLTITNGVDYIASLSEKMYNLASFKVPFLSYLTMILLVAASAGFYLIPFNYLMMLFGIYKFTRKYVRPERLLNNDLEDFLSRIPDTEILNDWKELNVPEPVPVPVNGNYYYSFKGCVMY